MTTTALFVAQGIGGNWCGDHWENWFVKTRDSTDRSNNQMAWKDLKNRVLSEKLINRMRTKAVLLMWIQTTKTQENTVL